MFNYPNLKGLLFENYTQKGRCKWVPGVSEFVWICADYSTNFKKSSSLRMYKYIVHDQKYPSLITDGKINKFSCPDPIFYIED